MRSLLYIYSALLIVQSPVTLSQVYKVLKEKFKKHKLSLPKRVAVTVLGSVAALLYSPFHLLLLPFKVVKELTKKPTEIKNVPKPDLYKELS